MVRPLGRVEFSFQNSSLFSVYMSRLIFYLLEYACLKLALQEKVLPFALSGSSERSTWPSFLALFSS